MVLYRILKQKIENSKHIVTSISEFSKGPSVFLPYTNARIMRFTLDVKLFGLEFTLNLLLTI